ncbi:hypothetical protein H8356DRAFT_1321932 [Neocallimastix lanati (nom. inval.)]|nr:hypothetical protein H8356DRAFT_1321932 [Neocallimastix sp. JGI-2020a]
MKNEIDKEKNKYSIPRYNTHNYNKPDVYNNNNNNSNNNEDINELLPVIILPLFQLSQQQHGITLMILLLLFHNNLKINSNINNNLKYTNNNLSDKIYNNNIFYSKPYSRHINNISNNISINNNINNSLTKENMNINDNTINNKSFRKIKSENEGSKLIKQKAYRISQIQFSTLNEKLKKLIEKRLIAPFHLPWSSPILLMYSFSLPLIFLVDTTNYSCTREIKKSHPLIPSTIFEFMKRFLNERMINIIGMAHRIRHEDRIKKNYYWKIMIMDIKKYIIHRYNIYYVVTPTTFFLSIHITLCSYVGTDEDIKKINRL